MTRLIYKLNINFAYYKINIKELFFRLYFVTKPPNKDYLCRIFKSKKHAGSDKKIVLPTLKNDLRYATEGALTKKNSKIFYKLCITIYALIESSC